MTIICEECGKIYQLAPEKLKNFEGDQAMLKCKQCGHVIPVSKSDIAADAEKKEIAAAAPSPPEKPATSKVSFGTQSSETKTSDKSRKAPEVKPEGLGLRSKMLILFLVIPLLLMAGIGYYSLRAMGGLASKINNESSIVLREFGEDNIADIARAVALQCRIYLAGNPELRKEDFNSDMEFRRIAVQKVGRTGYTILFQMPRSEDGTWTIWAHPDAKVVGIEDPSILKGMLGDSYKHFFKILNGARGGQESKGYFNWRESDNRVREKFMACAPVKNTPYIVTSTTNIDEFTGKIKELEKYAQAKTLETRNINFFILLGTLIIIGLTISIYAQRLTNAIKTLTDAADRISVGELDVEIKITNKDEIGNLAEAISRMQDSLRLSITRLRKRH